MSVEDQNNKNQKIIFCHTLYMRGCNVVLIEKDSQSKTCSISKLAGINELKSTNANYTEPLSTSC